MTDREFEDLELRIRHLERSADSLRLTDPQEYREIQAEIENARSAYQRERDVRRARGAL